MSRQGEKGGRGGRSDKVGGWNPSIDADYSLLLRSPGLSTAAIEGEDSMSDGEGSCYELDVEQVEA